MATQKMKTFSVFLLFIGLLSIGFTTQAQTHNHKQTLMIIKYGLSPDATGFIADQTINTGQKINNLPIFDNRGKELSPLSGISYTIQEVTATGSKPIDQADSSTYQKIGQSKTIITDSSGVAAEELADGFYLVTEVANEAQGLWEPAAPVLIALPVWEAESQSLLGTVYIYPKSSVDKESTTPIPPSSAPNTPSPSQPDQSANSGTQSNDPDSINSDSMDQIVQGLLPNTGEAKSLIILLIGASLLIFAIVIRKGRSTRCGSENEK